MATFELQGPDGKTYTVEAPDAQSAISALGSLVGSGGGVSVNQQAAGELGSNLGQMADGALTGLRNGMTLGFADELKGAAAVPLGGMPTDQGFMSMGNFDVPAGERYRATRDRVRMENEQAGAAAPGSQMAGEVLGGGAVSAAAVPAAVGKSTLGTILRMAGFGAAEGAAFGAGNSDGAMSDRAASAATGALIGGGLGAAAVPAASLVRGVGRMVADPIRGAYGAATNQGSERVASRAVARALNRQDMGIEELDAYLRQSADEGQPMMTIADALGNPGQRALAGATRTPGAGRTEAVEFLDARQADQGDRLSRFVAEGLEAPDTAAQRRARLTGERSVAADTNYRAARDGAGPVDVRGALEAIDARIGGMQGSGVTGDGIDARLSAYRSRLAANPNALPEGTTSRELSDFDRVLGVKQDLQDDIGAAVRAGRNNEARELGRLMSELDAALEASSGGYRTANDTFRRQSQAIDAIDTGAAATSPRLRAEDTVPQFTAMPPDQQSAYRAGYADPLLARIGASAPGVNAARPLMNTKTGTELGAIATDPELLQRRIGRENTMFETRRQATGGSLTADNIADQADMSGVDVGMIANLLSGRFGAAATDGARHVANVATGKNEETRAMIARALLSNDPQKALAAALRRDMADQGQQRIIEALMRQSGLQGAEGAGYVR